MNPSKGPVHAGYVVLLTAALTPGGFVLAQNLLLAPIKKDMARLITHTDNQTRSDLIQSTPVDTGSFCDAPTLETLTSPPYLPVFNQEAFSILLSDLTETLHTLDHARACNTEIAQQLDILRTSGTPPVATPAANEQTGLPNRPRLYQTNPEKPCGNRQPFGFPPLQRTSALAQQTANCYHPREFPDNYSFTTQT